MNLELRYLMTAEELATLNPILEPWQMGKESDTGRVKTGDGKTAWNDLEYLD